MHATTCARQVSVSMQLIFATVNIFLFSAGTAKVQMHLQLLTC